MYHSQSYPVFFLNTLLKSILLLLVFFIFTQTTEAKTIKRGESATLSWSVGVDSYCTPDFQGNSYPSIGDGVRSAWVSSLRYGAGNVTFPSVWGDSGQAFPQTYTFRCTSVPSGVSGIDTLTITACLGSETWNGSSCVPVSGPSAPTPTAIPGGCSSGSINVTWPSTGAEYYQVIDNGVGITGPIYGTSFNHTSLAPGSSHSYTISAYASGIWSGGGASSFASAPANCPPGAPTANFVGQVNGGALSRNLTANVGDRGDYYWSSTNGTSFGSTWSAAGSCTYNGLSGGWSATTAGGNDGGIYSVEFAGCTVTITYYVSGPGGSANDTVYITVNASAPPAPTPTATPGACNSNSIYITWPVSAGADYYQVFDNGVALTGAYFGTSLNHTSLTPGSYHSYTVSAHGTNGTWSGTGAAGAATAPANCPPVPPAAPTPTATPGACNSNSIYITWPAQAGVDYWQVFDNGVALTGAHYTNSLTHTSLTPGSYHSYTISAHGTNGTWSGTGAAGAATAPANCPPVPPAAPTPTATPGACGSGAITITWPTEAGVDYWQVFHNGVALTGAYFSNSITHTGLPAGSYNSYTISAHGTNGTWSGTGAAGAATAPSACPLPPSNPPTSISASCPIPGTTANISWPAAPGATFYAFRIDNQTSGGWNGTCSGGGDMCSDIYATSYAYSGTPGHNYNVWVHACNVNGCTGPAVSTTFTCMQLQAPVVSVSGTTAHNDGTPKARIGYSTETGTAVVNWSATNNPTSCSLYRNGSFVQGVAASGSYNLVVGLSTNVDTYRVDCSNGTGTGSDQMTFQTPPALSGFTATCPSPGTSLTMNWSAPFAWNLFYTRVQLGSNPVDSYNDQTGNSQTVASTPGGAYHVWIHTKAPNGAFGPASDVWLNCGVTPAPVVTVSGVTTHNDGTPKARIGYVGETSSAVVSWSATNNPTSCVLYRNGGAVQNVSASGSYNLVVGLTANPDSYQVNCVNAGGLGFDAMTFQTPPLLTGLTASCPAPGNSLTFNWTTGVAWNAFYTRVQEDSNPIQWYNGQTGNSQSVASTPGSSQHIWVHSRGPNGSYGQQTDFWTTCGVPAVDLTVTNLTPAGSSFVTTNSFTLTGRITNAGPGNSAQAGATRFDIDTNGDGISDGTGDAYGGSAVGPLAAGASANLSYTYGPGVGPGNYAYRFRVDVAGAQTETNEGNNTSPWTPFTVTPAPPPIPTAPASMTGSCPIPGNVANISWPAVAGATYYALRVDNQTTGAWNGTCSGGGDMCTDVAGTSYAYSSIANNTYGTWLHACNVSGCSGPVYGGFTCANSTPAPIVTVSGTTFHNDGTSKARIGYANETSSAVVNWSVTNNPTSCSLYRNGVFVQGVAASGSYALVSGLTANVDTYRVDCSNPSGSGTDSMTFQTPPLLTSLTATCPMPGTSLTMNWTTGVAWNLFYTRVQDGSNPVQWYNDQTGNSQIVASTPTGSYHVWVHSKAPNGAYGQQSDAYVTCTPAYPNLVASAPTVSPSTVMVGNSVNFTGSIRNSGNAVAGPYTNGVFYIDNNGDGNADYTTPASSVNVSTGIGASNNTTGSWTVPAGAPAGNNYRAAYYADNPSTVYEGPGDGDWSNFSGWSAPFTVNPAVPANPPASITGSCLAPGTTASISWPSAAGATFYALRVDNQTTGGWNGTCSGGGDMCADIAGTSYSYSSLPNNTYTTWVHACNVSGCSGAVSSVFTCNAPTPVVTVSGVTTHNDGTPKARIGYVNETNTAVVNWSATNNPTSCSLYRNGTFVQNVAASGSYNLVVGLSANVDTYRVDCTNVTGTGSDQMTFQTPPLLTGLTATCPAPGNALTFNWTTGVAWNLFYTRVQEGANPIQWYNNQTGNTQTVASTPGSGQRVWVHTKSPNGAYGLQTEVLVTCGLPPVDLTVVNLTPAGSAFVTTSPFTLTGRITNAGPGNSTQAGTTRIDIDSNADGITDVTGDAYGGSSVGPLAAGASANLSYTFGAGTTPGNYQYRFRIDVANAQTESNEANNTSAWTTFAVSAPDLNVTASTFPSGTLAPGVPVTLRGTVRNSGTSPTLSGFSNNFSYDTGSGWTNLPLIPKGILATGATASEDTQSHTPAAAGNIRYQYCTDSALNITESNEANNCVQSGWLPVVVPPPSTPSSFTGSTGTCGGAINLNWAAASGADSYEISLNNGSTWPYTGITGTSRTIIGLPINTTYNQIVLRSRNNISGVSLTNAGPISVVSSGICQTLIGSGCNIPDETSSCAGRVTWDITGATSPSIVNLLTGSTVSNNASGTNIVINLNYKDNTIEARDGVSVIRSIVLEAVCGATSFFHTGLSVCKPRPVIDILPSPVWIRSGQRASLRFIITANYDLSCTFTGQMNLAAPISHTGSLLPQTYLRDTNTLTSAQVVRITCTAPGLTPDESEEIRVNVLPAIQET